MKARINLYQQRFRPTVVLLSLNFAFLVWGVVLVAIVLAGLGVYEIKRQIQSEAVVAAQAVRDKTKLLDVLTRGRDNRVENPQLLTQLEETQKQLKIKTTIVEELAKREQQKSRGFSVLMLDLAAHHQQDLWLTEISLNESQMRIKGGATDSAAVPNWVSKLSSADYFIGQEFAAARLFRDEDEVLQFVLSSNLADVEGGRSDE